MSLLNSKERKARDRGRKQGKEMAIEEFNRILEETRSHKFGVCDADFVIDVIEAKIKEHFKDSNPSVRQLEYADMPTTP